MKKPFVMIKSKADIFKILLSALLCCFALSFFACENNKKALPVLAAGDIGENKSLYALFREAI